MRTFQELPGSCQAQVQSARTRTSSSSLRLNTVVWSAAFLLAGCAGQGADTIGPITAVAPMAADGGGQVDIARLFEVQKKNAVVSELPPQF